MLSSSFKELDKLKTVMTKALSDKIIFRNQYEYRGIYYEKEVEWLADRDFQTRLLMTSVILENNSVWV
jgi:hypothetical protein